MRTICSRALRWTRTSSGATTPRRSWAAWWSTRWSATRWVWWSDCSRMMIATHCRRWPGLTSPGQTRGGWIPGPWSTMRQKTQRHAGIISPPNVDPNSSLQEFAVNMWKKFQSWKVVGFSNLPQFLQVWKNAYWKLWIFWFSLFRINYLLFTLNCLWLYCLFGRITEPLNVSVCYLKLKCYRTMIFWRRATVLPCQASESASRPYSEFTQRR